MTQRYIDLAFDDTSPRSFGGFDNENEATVIRLKVLDPDAKYYIEIEQACGKHDKYCSDALPVADGHAVFEVPRDFTHETLYVQGVMKVDGMCRKTARVRVGFSHSINALDELPESQPSWADSVDERIDGLEMGMKDAVTYTPQTLTEEQQAQARTNIGAGQHDWNQNDESAQDYIKNRTHWKEEVKPLKIDGIGVKYTDDGWYLGSEFPINQDVFFADCPISICKHKITTIAGSDPVGIFVYANTNKYKQVALLDENDKIIVRFGLVLNMSEVVDGKVYYLQRNAGNMADIEDALASLGYTLEDVRGLLLLNNIERFEHIKMKTLSSSDGATICTFNDELYDDMPFSSEYRMLPFILEGGVQDDGAIIWLNLSMIMPYKCISIYDSQDNLVFWFNSSKAIIDRTDDCYFNLINFKDRKGFYYAKDINFDSNAEYTVVCESNLFVHSALSLYEGALVRTYTPKDVIFNEGGNKVLIIVDGEAVNIIGDIIPNNGRSALIQYMLSPDSYYTLKVKSMVSLEVMPGSLTAYCGSDVKNSPLNSEFTLLIYPSFKAAYEYYNR